MQTRIRYLPIEEVVAGMIVGEKLTDNHLRPLLPAGAVLTDENLHQLLAHQVEFVCIAAPDERTPQDIVLEAEVAKQRIEAIFSCADQSAPHIAALCEQLVRYRSV